MSIVNARMSPENVEGINQHLYSSDTDVQTTLESETVQTEFHQRVRGRADEIDGIYSSRGEGLI